jgi:pimeloyl-ACP methyl ester carboxylesterase
MPYLEVNDIRMYFEEYGAGQPIIFLSGATGAIEDKENHWGELAKTFSRKYRTILIEHRGHGRTNNPRNYLNYELMADDICKFIEKMQISPAHICGLSDGAIMALHIGMTNPYLAHSLICLGANYYNDELVKEANKFADVQKIEKETPELAVHLANLHDRNKQPGYWRTLVEQLAANLAINPQYTIKDLQKIPVPTLLISGENDLWANHQQMFDMRKNIPVSEMLIVNNAGHEAQFSHPHIVEPVIMDFLARHKDFWLTKRSKHQQNISLNTNI